MSRHENLTQVEHSIRQLTALPGSHFARLRPGFALYAHAAGFGMATYERGLKETQTKAMEAIAKANIKAKEQVKDRRLQQRQKGGHVERATRATA